MADPVTESLDNPSGPTSEPAPATDPGDDVGTTAPAEPTGQAETSAPTGDTDTFFDPNDLSPELQPAYKQMQAAYTRKTQAIAEQRRKIEEYDRFMSDPQYRQALIQQYAQSQPAAQSADEWEPQTWDDVIAKAEERAYSRFMGEMQPLLQEVRGVKKTQIEKDLDAHVPEWRQYEDEMTETLRAHPTLANDPVKLARIALPDEVLQSKAMQAALKKLQAKKQGASVSGGSTTQAAPAGAKPNRKMTFNEAADWARQQVAGLAKG